MGYGTNWRRTVLTALVLGLLLCPAGPAAADPTGPQKRLTDLEKIIDGLEDIATRYRLAEAELALHLSAARRRESRALAAFGVTDPRLKTLLAQSEPGPSEQVLGAVRRLTPPLQSALQAWQQEVTQARRFQDEICEKAEALKASPPPAAGQISGWSSRAGRLLETSTANLRSRRMALTSAWEQLNRECGVLENNARQLESFLSQADALEAGCKQLRAVVDGLREAQKDLARAADLRQELAALRGASPVPPATVRDELQELRGTVAQSADLTARIDADFRRLDSAGLPQDLPQIGEMDPRVEIIASLAEQVDPARVKANIQRAGTAAADARGALSAARTVLQEASSSLAGFGGLGRGRQCQDALRRAEAGTTSGVDQGPSRLGELQTRLEAAERREHLFIHRNQANHEQYRQANRMVAEATDLYKSWHELPGQLRRLLGDVDSAPIITNMETLLAELARLTQAFQKNGELLARIAEKTRQKKQEICANARKVDALPAPSGDQLRTWQQQSRSQVDDLKSEQDAAHRAARAQAGFLEEQTQKVAAAKDQLVNSKDGMLVWLHAQADVVVRVDRAVALFKQAESEGGKAGREHDELLKLKEAALKELAEIQAAAADLAAKPTSAHAAAELETIRARAAALASNYQRAVMGGRLASPPVTHDEMEHAVRTVGSLVGAHIGNTEQKIGEAVRTIKQAEEALTRAQEARQAAADKSAAASGVLIEAEKCVAALARGPRPAGGGSEDQARRALASCDLTRAKDLINALPPGPGKDELVRQLNDQRARQAALGTLVVQAENEFDNCRLQNSLDLLLQAQGQAECQDHRKKIAAAIATVNDAQAAEPEFLTLLGEATAHYRDCRLAQALEILKQAQPLAKCKKYQKKVARMIDKATKKQEHEKLTVQMFESAKKLIAKGKLGEARDLLVKAKSHTTCDRYETDLEKWIARVNDRINSQAGTGQGGQGGGSSGGGRGQVTCQERALQIRLQAAQVGRLLTHFHRQRLAGQPDTITGPLACELLAAGKTLTDMKSQAAQAGCQEAAGIEDPLGAGDNAPRLVCQRWRDGQGQGQGQGQGGQPVDQCQEWQRKVSEAEALYLQKQGVWAAAARDVSQPAGQGQTARLRKATCEMLMAQRALRAVVRSARMNHCQVRADALVIDKEIDNKIRQWCN